MWLCGYGPYTKNPWVNKIITFLDFSSRSHLKLTLTTQASWKSIPVVSAVSCFMKTGHNLNSLKPFPAICYQAVLDAIWMLSVSDQAELHCCFQTTLGGEEYLVSLHTCGEGPTFSDKSHCPPQSAHSLQPWSPTLCRIHPLSTSSKYEGQNNLFYSFLDLKNT